MRQYVLNKLAIQLMLLIIEQQGVFQWIPVGGISAKYVDLDQHIII